MRSHPRNILWVSDRQSSSSLEDRSVVLALHPGGGIVSNSLPQPTISKKGSSPFSSQSFCTMAIWESVNAPTPRFPEPSECHNKPILTDCVPVIDTATPIPDEIWTFSASAQKGLVVYLMTRREYNYTFSECHRGKLGACTRVNVPKNRPKPAKVPVWPIYLFIGTMVVPVEFSFFLGTLRLTAFRLYLIFLFFFLLSELLRSGRIRLQNFDFLVIAFGLWPFLSFSVVHGFEKALEAGGIFFLETVSPYFLARLFIVDPRSLRASLKPLLAVVFISLIVTIPEALLGRHFVHDFAASITGNSYPIRLEQRLGIWRAMGSFDHAILYGVFCASLAALVWYTAAGWKRLLQLSAVALSTVLSASSGPILAFVVQIALIVWEKASRPVKGRWYWLSGAIAVAYVVVDLASNRTPIQVLISYLTLNPFTAWIRIIQWDVGIDSIINNPLFGIGFNEHERPAWLTWSIDSFWLMLTMAQGLPSILLFSVSAAFLLRGVFQANVRGEKTVERLRYAWAFTFVALCFSGITVHFWAAMHSYFFFVMGAGAWIATRPQPQRPSGRPGSKGV